jgi:hypothetical protein
VGSLNGLEIAHWDHEPEMAPSPRSSPPKGERENPVSELFGALRRARFMERVIPPGFTIAGLSTTGLTNHSSLRAPRAGRTLSITQLDLPLRSCRQRVFLFHDCLLPGILQAARFSGIDFGARLKGIRKVCFGINRLDRTLGNASRAVDAIIRVDNQLIVHFIKAGHRADFRAIGELATSTLIGNNVGHRWR